MKIIFSSLVLVFLYSCSSPKSDQLKGKYIMIEKGFYKSLDFKDQSTVIVVDNLSMNMSFSVPYKVFDNVLYIQSDQGDLVYNIKGDTLSPPENTMYSSFAGKFVKE